MPGAASRDGQRHALVHPEHRQERLLRDLDGTHALHPLLALFLLLEQLALAGDVATVALGQHVLAHGADGFACDDIASRWPPGSGTSNIWRGISSLSRSVERPPVDWARSRWTMSDRASTGSPSTRMSTLTRLRRPVADLLVVHRGVALAAALELVEVVDDELGQGHLEVQQDPRSGRGTPCSRTCRAGSSRAPSAGRCSWLGVTTLSLTHGSWISSISDDGGQQRRVVDGDLIPRPRVSTTWYSTDGARRDEVEVELALEALLDDLHVEQAQEAAAEAEAERDRALRLVGEATRR